MEDAVFTAKELAARWKCHENTIRTWEDEGRLHRLQGLPNVRYSGKEVAQLESVGLDAQALTAWERKRMEQEIKNLQRQVKDLRDRLTRIMITCQGGGVQ